ncbi:MAG: AAA family ATPase [Bacteroidia bacterium]
MRYKNQNQTDKEFLQLKGNVNRLMQVVYKAVKQNGTTGPGTIIVDHGSEEKNFIFTFNNEGNIIEEDLYGQHFRTINKYSETGKKTEEIKYYLGNLYSVTTYKYLDDEGNITECITNDAEGRLMYRYENTYTPDTRQQLLHIMYHKMNGKVILTGKTEHTYHDEVITINNRSWRKPLTKIEYDKDGKITSNHTYTYNEKGLNIESSSVYSKTPHMNRKITYKHNEHGDVIETNFYNPDGTLQNSYVTAHEYDSEGKKIVPEQKHAPYVHYPDAIMLFSKGDETDDNGNWIKKITESPDKYITRMIVYEGEEKTFEHPLLNVENIPKETEREVEYERYKLEDGKAGWIAEWPNASGENFPFYRYYTSRFNEVPSMITYQGPNIEAMALLRLLKEKCDINLVHSYSAVWNGSRPLLSRFTINFNNQWGYMLHCNGISKHHIDEYLVPSEIEEENDEYVFIGQFSLLHPGEISSARDENFEEELSGYIHHCSLSKKPDKPVINIIEVKGGNFSMAEYAVNDDFIIKDLEINYGQGFEKFHNELMQRFNKSTKGLVLFHGEPGTGKTYYIRHLLRKMIANRKIVIYIPPNMVDHLVDPAFMTFLSNELKVWSEDGYFCVLLIEDAEPLLAKRQEGVRIQGVTNLLNMTDGLLNDMLNLQIICTFNVDLSRLDSALLRPGRLIARKEFKALAELDANLLAQRLGIKYHFDQPASLGEIYAMQKNQHTLVHEVEAKKNTSSAIDDL